jgi:hypothetical protein
MHKAWIWSLLLLFPLILGTGLIVSCGDDGDDPPAGTLIDAPVECITCCTCICTCRETTVCGAIEIQRKRSDGVCLVCNEVCNVGCAEFDYPIGMVADRCD